MRRLLDLVKGSATSGLRLRTIDAASRSARVRHTRRDYPNHTHHGCRMVGLVLSWILWIVIGLLAVSAHRLAVAPLRRSLRGEHPVSETRRALGSTFAEWAREHLGTGAEPRTWSESHANAGRASRREA